MLGNLIGGFIVILVGTTLAPTVAQNVGLAQADGNITGASDTILGLTTLFYCLSIASTAIGIAAQGEHKLMPLQKEIFDETSEYRLTSSRGQDRSVKHLNYALTTDKDYLMSNDKSKIYSLTFSYN
jgi:hypothetical protein